MTMKPLDWLRIAIDDDRLSTTERAAVAAITRRAPGKPQAKRFAGQQGPWDFYLSRNELAGLMAASIPTAERCLSRLHKLGLLEMVARGGRRGRGNGAQVTANVWRLTIANPSPVMGSNGFQPITGDDMEEASNPSGEHLPTHQRGAFQPITGDDPREHRLQESTVLQESTANAQSLTRLLVHEHHSTPDVEQTQTEVDNSGTDRESAEAWVESWPSGSAGAKW